MTSPEQAEESEVNDNNPTERQPTPLLRSGTQRPLPEAKPQAWLQTCAPMAENINSWQPIIAVGSIYRQEGQVDRPCGTHTFARVLAHGQPHQQHLSRDALVIVDAIACCKNANDKWGHADRGRTEVCQLHAPNACTAHAGVA